MGHLRRRFHPSATETHLITLAALCSSGKNSGRRFAYVAKLRAEVPSLIGPAQTELWIIDAIKSDDGRRCNAGCDADALHIRLSPEFPGCHFCGATSIFLCGCESGHLCCASGDWEKPYRAPCCGRAGSVEIGALSISRLTHPSPEMATLLRVSER